MIRLRANWRVIALVLLIVTSGVMILVPGLGLGADTEGPTNLQYGIELSGGARIEAPLVGVTAEGVDVTPENSADIQQSVVDEMDGVSQVDVEVRTDEETPVSDGGTVEVFADVTREELASALDAAGVEHSGVREGVTQPTRETTVDVMQSKIDASGLSGGTVQVSQRAEEHFIVVEVPNSNVSEVRSQIDTRGAVELVARFPGDDGVRNETVLTQADIDPGPVQPPNQDIDQYHVPITLTDTGAEAFVQAMRQNGFTSQEGTNACGPRTPEDQQYCIVTTLDGQVVHAASMNPGLAQDIESGDFMTGKRFVITASNRSEASELRISLEVGALPTTLDFEAGNQDFTAPSLAENFRIYSLITGLIAVFAVAGTVFVRYRNPLVAAPMVVTALSEVVILLGFAASVGLALDLSHIAGFVAVIGTGVDDLIIIADEVLSEGDVSSSRVFQSRFRKALWIIGAAAATTIVAMSPLVFLRIGDLFGFALVTILGVLVGVLITRPAYGDILRALMTDR